MSRRALLPATAWALVAIAAVGVLVLAGDPAGTAVRYLVVWVVSNTIPGVLLWRALAPQRSTVQDLGFGAATGVCWLLLAWAVTMVVGIPELLWLWPAGVIGAFVAVPALRRHWRPAPDHARPPIAWSVGMAVVCVLALSRLLVTTLRFYGLPPQARDYFRDLWYHLGIVEELSRTWRPQDPSVVGEPLRYHWFADAHMAATHLLSGAPVPEVTLHLWVVPMLVTLLLLVAAVAERLGGRWWAGPLAAAVVWTPPVTLVLSGFLNTKLFYTSGFFLESHSSCLGVLVLLALVAPVSDILTDRQGRGTWVLLALLVAVAAGAKPTVLPLALAATTVAGAVLWRVERRVPRRLLAVVGVIAVALAVATATVTGSTGGSKVQLLGMLHGQEAFTDLTGDSAPAASGGWLVGDLVGAGPSLWVLALAFFLWFVSTELPRMVGLATPFLPGRRNDPVAWWVTATVAGGFAATWLLSHPGYSQYYFTRTVEALGAVATVVLVSAAVPGDRVGAAYVRPVLLSAGAGAGVATVLLVLSPGVEGAGVAFTVAALLLPLLVLAATLAGVVVLLRRRGSGSAPPSLVLAGAFLLAAAVPGGVADTADTMQAAHDLQERSRSYYLTRGEQRAALWLESHSSPEDVVVTNVFCSPVAYRPGCSHDSFWVAGLTGRRLVLGGWAYTARNLTESSAAGVHFSRYRSPWPDRLRDSLAAVEQPTAAVLERLQSEYGARWIFADRAATTVSPRLERLADLRFRNAAVSIYELRDTASVNTHD